MRLVLRQRGVRSPSVHQYSHTRRRCRTSSAHTRQRCCAYNVAQSYQRMRISSCPRRRLIDVFFADHEQALLFKNSRCNPFCVITNRTCTFPCSDALTCTHASPRNASPNPDAPTTDILSLAPGQSETGLTLSSSTTHDSTSFFTPNATGTSLYASPHTSPSNFVCGWDIPRQPCCTHGGSYFDMTERFRDSNARTEDIALEVLGMK